MDAAEQVDAAGTAGAPADVSRTRRELARLALVPFVMAINAVAMAALDWVQRSQSTPRLEQLEEKAPQ